MKVVALTGSFQLWEGEEVFSESSSAGDQTSMFEIGAIANVIEPDNMTSRS